MESLKLGPVLAHLHPRLIWVADAWAGVLLHPFFGTETLDSICVIHIPKSFDTES